MTFDESMAKKGVVVEPTVTPAPDVDPVAWIRGSGLELLRQKQHATVFPSEGCSNHSIALYTRPAPSDELVKDAERYQWLRSSDLISAMRWEVRYWTGEYWDRLYKEVLDAAIDAALNKVKR